MRLLILTILALSIAACALKDVTHDVQPDQCDPQGICNVGKPTQGGN